MWNTILEIFFITGLWVCCMYIVIKASNLINDIEQGLKNIKDIKQTIEELRNNKQ